MSDSNALVKCLVWDLDETLWHGTVLEDGEVRLTDEIRDVIVALDSRGILQAVASKNDHDVAWAKLEEFGLAEYFVTSRIWWHPKSQSVREIAEQLQFAHGTIAFIDDQPTERAEVAFHLPEVRCYPADQATALTGLPEFSPEVVTVDARRRRQMYQATQRREAERSDFSGPDEEFLRSLELEMRIGRAGEEELTRVEELTRRTSQMNATGVHYSDSVLRGLLADSRHEVLVTTMRDRFGPHGAVGVLLVERHPSVWHLKLLATSCRVVSFGAGAVILNWLVDQAAQDGCHLVADFRATDRNRIMEVAYRFAGFAENDCGCRDDIPAADGPEGLQRLHLVPSARPSATTVRLEAPDLTTLPV
ncbi:methoxymalonate biosynthesis protein [Kibdelosporangium banguiense]|uniref:Methoxymalonate biosynthesis protein n=1 Tax=Kibdelosporangium banguiense TaxID=1365924 RepID=A0ABS4TZ05_9PSEU|nr:methoxymalonate biosynthesis protein [Kibdelosporangium banguiense]